MAPFEGATREAVHALKYEGRHAISSMMGKLMAGAAWDLKADLVVPISLHSSRRRERGYDQAALLARAVARELHLNCDAHILKRTRRTAQQVSLGPEERRSNVDGAFSATRQLHGEIVLLVDDVYTTGATMDAAAAALRASGVGSVIGLAFGYAEVGRDHASADRPATRWPRGPSTR